MLELRNVSKRFGGVVATDEVTLELKPGEVHALIGPNRAGKTTLIGQISGSLGSDGGAILFEGQDITHATPHTRVRAALARSYQITSMFKRFTALDNLALAVQARSGSSFSFWRPVSEEALLFDEARAIAGEIGLAGREAIVAATLAHGEQRALEVGLALATRPRLVLLDEPMAGMGPEESENMIALLERIRARITMLLVEHDMDAVFRLADRVSVLVSGRVIASGAPTAIRAHPGEKRNHPFPWRAHRRAASRPHRALRYRARPGRTPDLPQPERAGEFGRVRRKPQRDARPVDARQGAGILPRARGAHGQPRQPALGRRAADARHRSGAHDQSASPHPRRSDRGARAAGARGDLEMPRNAEGGRPDDPGDRQVRGAPRRDRRPS